MRKMRYTKKRTPRWLKRKVYVYRTVRWTGGKRVIAFKKNQRPRLKEAQ